MVLLGHSRPSTHGAANQPYTSLTVHLDTSDTCTSHNCLKAMHIVLAVSDEALKHWLQSTMVVLNCSRSLKAVHMVLAVSPGQPGILHGFSFK